MSARLGKNPIPNVHWKGEPLKQVTSQIKRNGRDANTTTDTKSMFFPQPLKIYRRELCTNSTETGCNPRISQSIDLLQMPNGYTITDNAVNAGLVNVLDITDVTNKSQNGDCRIPADQRTKHAYVCVEENAKRRVRSSGMIRRTFNTGNNSDPTYFTNTNQYLVSRARTFKQNQYTHIRNDNPSLLAEDTLYSPKTYSSNGISHCKRTQIIEGVNDTFYYFWTTFVPSDFADVVNAINTNPAGFDVQNSYNCFRVIIPPGDYFISELQQIFTSKLILNNHYYIEKATGKLVFLLKIIFNTIHQKIELQCYSDKIVSDTEKYDVPTHNGNVIGTTVGESSCRPAFYFPQNSKFAEMIGFQSAKAYPTNTNGSLEIQSEVSVGVLSSSYIHILPSYNIVHYKPSNSRFATQGAVSSSARSLRVKYDTVIGNNAEFKNTYDVVLGGALSFGTSQNIYTIKDRIGYPNKRIPVLCHSSSQVKCST